MVDFIFFILLALTASQPGQASQQVELYSDGQLHYRCIAEPTESGYTLSVVDSALELRQVAKLKRDTKGFEVLEEGAEEPRRIDIFTALPGWTQQATAGKEFSVEASLGEIRGVRSGDTLTISLDSDIDSIVIRPRP